MSLIAELKRRNVFRVGIAYVVTAWLVAQVGQVAAESFEAPAWVMKMFITFLALGLPFAMIFSWAFELTPDGLKKEKDVDRSKSITENTGRKLNYATTIVLSLAVGYFAWDKYLSGEDDIDPAGAEYVEAPANTPTEGETGADAPEDIAPAASPMEHSIAVLPFNNTSAGAENSQFFSDGIHDDLLTNLSKIHELKVISRTSVMAYRDTTKNMRQIGEELGVANLLEGSVQQAGNRVRINVQLIAAQSDEHLWAESYDREVTTENIFDIQGEISRAIATELEATLSPEEDSAIGVAPTRSLEAYEAVLTSRQLRERGGFSSLAASTEYAQRAIDLDPAYADAYLELAFTLITSINTGALTDAEAGERIRSAIQTAMSLQADYGAAWSVLGHYQAITGKSEADATLQKALILDPGSAQTMTSYGHRLQSTGQPELALPLLLKAIELDPLSPTVLFTLGRTYDVLSEYDKALALYARIRAIEPSSTLGYGPAAGVNFPRGRLDKAIALTRDALSVDPQDFEIGGWMVYLYDCLDDHVSARQWSDWLDSWVTDQPMPMAVQAGHHYLTGEFETAVQISNLALKLSLPNRWGSDAIFMRIKRDEAIASGNVAGGIELIGAQHPELLGDEPQITPNNILQAVDLAKLLKLAGRSGETQSLLHDQPHFSTGSLRSWLVPAKAEALAVLGDDRAALAELRRIIDEGWRIYWRWETELNPNFDGVRDTEEFKDMLAELEADLAEQATAVRAMTDSGMIAPPPEIEPS
jgi:TolB-like protein/tetratricopeptide (TPR) repeat protein